MGKIKGALPPLTPILAGRQEGKLWLALKMAIG